jgi:hypothetical protein
MIESEGLDPPLSFNKVARDVPARELRQQYPLQSVGPVPLSVDPYHDRMIEP